MADVRLNIAGREYLVTCRDGEEKRLTSLGAIVEEKVKEAGGSTSGLNESRQLLFASLLLADQIADSSASGGVTSAAPTSKGDSGDNDADSVKMAETLEKLAIRLESVADKLEQ